jgi:hypothetical protein
MQGISGWVRPGCCNGVDQVTARRIGRADPPFVADDLRGVAGLAERAIAEGSRPFRDGTRRHVGVSAPTPARHRDLGARILFLYNQGLPPGGELRLQRGEPVWVSASGYVAAFLSLTRHLPMRRVEFSNAPRPCLFGFAASNSRFLAGKFRSASGPDWIAVTQGLEVGER